MSAYRSFAALATHALHADAPDQLLIWVDESEQHGLFACEYQLNLHALLRGDTIAALELETSVTY